MNTTEIGLLEQKVRENLDLVGVTIPEEIRISTMTMDAKIDVKFNATNIYKYMRTSKDAIVRIKANTKKPKETKNKMQIESRNPKTSNSKAELAYKERLNNGGKEKKKKNSEEFLNQVTVYVNVSQKEKPVSVKIFECGTLHYTGVVSIASLLEATYKICEECKRSRSMLVETRNPDKSITRKIEKIDFVDDVDKLNIHNLYDFAVSMINCNFKVPFKVDRPKLLVNMVSDGYNAAFDSNGHSAVNIKYKVKNSESMSRAVRVRDTDDLGKNEARVTIFVFEPGSIIIILGNQGFRPIDEVYTFIYKYLLENFDTIAKNDELTDSSIREYLEESEFRDTVSIFEGNPNSTAYTPSAFKKKNVTIDTTYPTIDKMTNCDNHKTRNDHLKPNYSHTKVIMGVSKKKSAKIKVNNPQAISIGYN
jgi:hypothetical protein